MSGDQIRSLRTAHPFRPFVMIFSDGRRFPVTQPYFLAIDRSGKRASVATQGESMQFFDPAWVSAVEWIDSGKPSKGETAA